MFIAPYYTDVFFNSTCDLYDRLFSVRKKNRIPRKKKKFMDRLSIIEYYSSIKQQEDAEINFLFMKDQVERARHELTNAFKKSL